jgi:hypothetical protein
VLVQTDLDEKFRRHRADIILTLVGAGIMLIVFSSVLISQDLKGYLDAFNVVAPRLVIFMYVNVGLYLGSVIMMILWICILTKDNMKKYSISVGMKHFFTIGWGLFGVTCLIDIKELNAAIIAKPLIYEQCFNIALVMMCFRLWLPSIIVVVIVIWASIFGCFCMLYCC